MVGKRRHGPRNILLISYHPRATATEVAARHDFARLRRYAESLLQQGHRVYWLSSTDTVDVYASDAVLEPDLEHSIPEICRYAVPCHAYRLGGTDVFCVDCAVWQQRSLHTRLFTFLCLLQRALSCDVFHAWGMFPAAYLTVYTARFLGLPAVVSYSEPSLREASQEPFVWHWVAQHVTTALVFSESERQRLLATSGLSPSKIYISDGSPSEAIAALITSE